MDRIKGRHQEDLYIKLSYQWKKAKKREAKKKAAKKKKAEAAAAAQKGKMTKTKTGANLMKSKGSTLNKSSVSPGLTRQATSSPARTPVATTPKPELKKAESASPDQVTKKSESLMTVESPDPPSPAQPKLEKHAMSMANPQPSMLNLVETSTIMEAESEDLSEVSPTSRAKIKTDSAGLFNIIVDKNGGQDGLAPIEEEK